MNVNSQVRFTLIELLVVVAIISVLASMLLPVLSKARQRATAAKCLGTTRQIGLALVQYNGDFDDFSPPTHDRDYSGGGAGVRIGLGDGAFYDSASNTTRNLSWVDRIAPYASLDVFHCPSVDKVSAGHPGTIKDYSHYGLNYYLDEKPKRFWGLTSVTKISHVVRPSEVFQVVEKGMNGGEVNRSSGTPEALPFDNNWFIMPYRHGNSSTWQQAYAGSTGGANYLYCDGHADYLGGDTPGLVSGASLGAVRHDSAADRDRLWNAGQ